jgi:hypothetical protein
MISKKKVRTIYLFIAAMTMLMIALPSAVYLRVQSISFLVVMLTALIAIGVIVYFILQHDVDAMN